MPSKKEGKKAYEILMDYCEFASNHDRIPNKSISIISTSQGSSFTFSLLVKFPKFREKIKNIVFCSPAFSGPGNKISGVSGNKAGDIIIQALKGIPTLFIETQHGFARHDTPGDPWGDVVRRYFESSSKDNNHFKVMIPTTQHSGDVSKKSAYGGCKSTESSKFCNCPDVLSDYKLMYNQNIQGNIWRLIHLWCKKKYSYNYIVSEIKKEIKKILKEDQSVPPPEDAASTVGGKSRKKSRKISKKKKYKKKTRKKSKKNLF